MAAVNTHLDRYRQVAEILARHGLGFIVGAAGLDRWVPFHQGMLGHEQRQLPYTNPDHLRLALEELGPAFIKLGQILSTRSDLLPPEYQAELSKLQDAVPPIDVTAVREVISQELGIAPEELFEDFDPEPLASASIGQAHAATLTDGTAVVVKVRRPGVVARIDEDLEILQNLAAQASRRWQEAADYNLTGIAAEFAETLRAELDYLQEGRNAETFARNFSSYPDVHVPRVFWASTTSRVLTLERVKGAKVNDIEALDHAGVDRRALAQRAAAVLVKMVFDDGFFHADPHPGNLFIETGGRIGLIDFGMVGKVDEKLRGQLRVLLLAMASSNPGRLAAALLDLSATKRPVDPGQMRADLTGFISLYEGRELGQIEIAPLARQLLTILRTYHLLLPREMAMLAKMLIMAEGMGARLDPAFNLVQVLKPYAQRMLLEQFEPQALAARLGKAGLEVLELGTELPEKVRRVFDLVDSGMDVHLRAAELEPLIQRAEKIGNRLVAGMIAAAFLRGIGELAAGDRERWGGWEVPLMRAGLGTAGALSAYLLWTARQKKRRGGTA